MALVRITVERFPLGPPIEWHTFSTPFSHTAHQPQYCYESSADPSPCVALHMIILVSCLALAAVVSVGEISRVRNRTHIDETTFRPAADRLGLVPPPASTEWC